MTYEEIISGNKLIAEFMGAPRDSNSLGEVVWIRPPENELSRWLKFTDLKYHSSWDWLMIVCGKITAMNDIELDGLVFLNDMYTGLKMIDIKTVWRAVIEFIYWQNKNNRQLYTKWANLSCSCFSNLFISLYCSNQNTYL